MSEPDEARDAPGDGRAAAASRRLGRFLGGASAVVLALLVTLAAVEAAAWVLAGASWPELAEIQGLLLVWLTFLTAAWGVERGLHLGMALLVERLPPAAQTRLESFVALLVAVFGALCAWHGARLAASVVNTLPATGWSAGWQYVPAAAGGLLIAAAALLRLAGRGPGGGRAGARTVR